VKKEFEWQTQQQAMENERAELFEQTAQLRGIFSWNVKMNSHR
jgi:hypothetical protein